MKRRCPTSVLAVAALPNRQVLNGDTLLPQRLLVHLGAELLLQAHAVAVQ